MFRSSTFFLALAALASTLPAQDFGPVVRVAGRAYPERNHFGIVCNYGVSRTSVEALLQALPQGTTLTVVDARYPLQIERAATVLTQRGVQLLALMPRDPLVHDGSAFATLVVQAVGEKIPAFGTRPAALKNGCVMALGQDTNWELLYDPKIRGIIEVTGAEPLPMGSKGGPRATLDLVSMGH